MNNTEQTFRRMFLEDKTQQFIDSKYGLTDYFETYKGKLLLAYQYRQRDFIDFLVELEKFGFTRDEVEDCILAKVEVKEHVSL